MAGTPRRRRRGWWAWGGLTLLLPAAAVAVLFARFDPDSLKPALLAAVERSTGRTLHIGGPLHLRWALAPTLDATDVSLANLPGGSRPDMARAERIALTVSLPALLQHRIELQRLVLVGPNILFEQVDGRPNWRFDLPEPSGGAGAGGAAAPFELAIRNAQVQNGMVTWRLPARTKVLGIRILDVSHPRDGGAVEAGGTFVYGDNQPFDLHLAGQPTAGVSGPWNTWWRFAAFDTVATAAGTMDTAGHYDLQVDGQAGALEALNALLPAMRLPALHGAAFSARLGHGRQPGDLPVLGAARLRFASADGAPRLPGLVLGASEVAVDKPGGTATLRAQGRWAGQAFAVSGTVGVPLHPDDRAGLALDLQAKGAAGSVSAKGRLGLRALAFDGLDAAVALDAPALAALRPLASPALPAFTAVRFAAHLAVPAHMDAATLGGMALFTDQGDLAGDATLRANGAVQARVRSQRLDMDAVLDAFGFHPGPPERRPGGSVVPDTPLRWDALRGPALDVSGHAATVDLHGEAWRDVDLAVRMGGGTLDASGRLAGAVLTVAADGASLRVGVDAPALPLAALAREAGLPGPVSGTARVEARLAGSARSPHDWAATLDGTASVVALDGRMTNAAFTRLAAASLEPLNITVPLQGETVLRCLGIGAAFKAGVGTLAPLALETTHLSLDGAGQVDLRHETVALQLRPLARVAGSPVAVPVVVEGPFRALAGRLDASGLDKVGLLLDGVFGGDESTACADAGLVPKR